MLVWMYGSRKTNLVACFENDAAVVSRRSLWHQSGLGTLAVSPAERSIANIGSMVLEVFTER